MTTIFIYYWHFPTSRRAAVERQHSGSHRDGQAVHVVPDRTNIITEQIRLESLGF